VLGRLHLLGVVAAALFLLASIVMVLLGLDAGGFLPSIGVLVMLALTLVSQDMVIRRMIHLRREMVSVVATPLDNPLRAEFERLHGVSVDLEGAVLLIGFASLFLTLREPKMKLPSQ